jgi:hypothetical protein
MLQVSAKDFFIFKIGHIRLFHSLYLETTTVPSFTNSAEHRCITPHRYDDRKRTKLRDSRLTSTYRLTGSGMLSFFACKNICAFIQPNLLNKASRFPKIADSPSAQMVIGRLPKTGFGDQRYESTIAAYPQLIGLNQPDLPPLDQASDCPQNSDLHGSCLSQTNVLDGGNDALLLSVAGDDILLSPEQGRAKHHFVQVLCFRLCIMLILGKIRLTCSNL